MNNVTTKIDSTDLKRLVEEYLNKTLSDNHRAKVMGMLGNPDCTSDPNRPGVNLLVTFDVVQVDPE